MSKIWLPGGGGGTDLDVVTAGSGDILAGKVIVGPDGEPLTGTLALTGTAADSQVLAGQTYYNTDAKTKRTGSMVNRGAVSQSLGINGSYTIPAGYHNGSGKVTQNIPTQGGSTITPGTAAKTAVAAGRYVSGNVIVAGDPNLLAANIVKGKSIFGVTGTAQLYPNPLYIYKYNTGWMNISPTRMTLTHRTMGEVSGYGSGGFGLNDSGNYGTELTCYWSPSTSGTRGSGIWIVRTKAPINLTAYTTLSCECYSSIRAVNSTFYIGVSTNANLTSISLAASTSWTHNSTSVSSGDDRTASVNVSSLSGDYYIYMCANATNSVQTSGADHVAALYFDNLYLV